MELASPKMIAEKHGISLKTVYNYINKNPEKIRKQKQHGKTFVSVKDFESVLNPSFQYYNSASQETSQIPVNKDFGKGNEEIEKLQNQLEVISEKAESLVKYNANLEDQVTKYAIQFKEEKKEKQGILEKYDNLNSEFIKKVEDHAKERIKWSRKYYVAIALLLLCISLLALVMTGILEFSALLP